MVNIDEYEKIATVIFNDYKIPFFLDKKREILNNPLVVLIISSLEILDIDKTWYFDNNYSTSIDQIANWDNYTTDRND